MSLRLNFPVMMAFPTLAMASSSPISSVAISMRADMSPIPRRRDMKRLASKGSRSRMCSPVPMKTILALVLEVAEIAPPPFAVPSILVSMTPVTPTAAWKASAWGPAC